jgi:hypothetical protein
MGEKLTYNLEILKKLLSEPTSQGHGIKYEAIKNGSILFLSANLYLMREKDLQSLN